MSKTIVVVGFGPGISTGVAEKFGAEGFNVALVGRTKERLDAGAAALKAKGINAVAFVADASNPAAIGKLIDEVRATFGTITAIHWNAYGDSQAGDLTAASETEIRGVFDVAISGLLSAVQTALPDLKASKGAVLITNGAFGELNDQINHYAAASNNMGLAMANAAKHKLVGLLAAKLKADDVFVGEVMIAGSIKGTSWAAGNPNPIEPSLVGETFYKLFDQRADNYARLS
ncbi:MAG: SDR family NAD(P)-dependent oxidoreductase [Hyphomicrobiales bacterium]|nr:MAG: SDR family NAD(P)-dependent oxidoreductase [Hyphomicrobiales bacterium]